MGFNAPMGPEDSEKFFYNDTMRSGAGINRTALARVLAQKTRAVVEDLERRGMEFAREGDAYDLLQPLGCSYPRLAHYNSSTGLRIGKLLLHAIEEKGVHIIRSATATDLILHEGEVIGACAINSKNGTFPGIHAKSVVLTAGGCGKLYHLTTYPSDIRGDGYAMAFRAGAEMIDMEFVQFEPCCFVFPAELEGEPIPTTTLREGGSLRNGKGEEILGRHGLKDDPSLQKDALSRALYSEIMEGRGAEHGGIWLDISMLPRDMITINHSIFYTPALKAGVDLTKDPAEVAPAAHTSMGGIVINERCETSLDGLYAAGEVIGGLHGANRIGGNAGSETLVFGALAGQSAAGYAEKQSESDTGSLFQGLFDKKAEEFQALKATDSSSEALASRRRKIQDIMQRRVGIIRDEEGLKTAIADLEKHSAELCDTSAIELENMATVGMLIATAALERRESRGVHFRRDYSERNDEEWKKNVVLKRSDSGIETAVLPCR